MEPLTMQFGVKDQDNRAIFPMIDRTGESLIIIPADKFTVVETTEKSIILRLIQS
jgi:hypothetical protein